MQLQLTEEERAFREEMRTFFTTEVPEELRSGEPRGDKEFKEAVVTTQQLLNAKGLAVPAWPTEYGGQDWTPLQKHIWHEEMQLAGVIPPLAFNANMIGPVIANFGSDEMKDKFLAKTANLDIWWCQGFSEPNAGSDLASLSTKAVRDGDDWVINGQKTWTTLGQHADWIFVLCRTNPDVKKQAGISMILVPMEAEGVTLRPIQLIDGGHEVNEVFFEDVRVPAENLVGEENAGWTYAKFLLGNERVGVAPVGASKRNLAIAKEQAEKSGVLAEDPELQAAFVDLENELLALELTALRVAANSEGGKPHPASSVLKLKGTELQQAVSELMVDVFGPQAIASGAVDVDGGSDLPMLARTAAPTYLNLRKASIYGGSNEVQRQIIAGNILGL